MIRPWDWSLDEFMIVLANPGMPPAKLIPQLPRRTGGAIGAVQQGIHVSSSRFWRIGSLWHLIRSYAISSPDAKMKRWHRVTSRGG
jgi:hypothetical protein